jgi:hypothetical protein
MILISNSSPHAEVAMPLIPQPLLPRGEKGSKISFLVPISLNGRRAKGEGLRKFCVTSVSNI